jgi:hypothetical protein
MKKEYKQKIRKLNNDYIHKKIIGGSKLKTNIKEKFNDKTTKQYTEGTVKKNNHNKIKNMPMTEIDI